MIICTLTYCELLLLIIATQMSYHQYVLNKETVSELASKRKFINISRWFRNKNIVLSKIIIEQSFILLWDN